MAPTDVQFAPDWALLNTVQDEVKDAWRVQKQGQEEDLRDALGRVLKRVEEMTLLLTSAFKSHSELETALKLAKSNYQMALANNEMLEDALRRDTSGKSRDVGWRRTSSTASNSPALPANYTFNSSVREDQPRSSLDSMPSPDLRRIPPSPRSPRSATMPLPSSASAPGIPEGNAMSPSSPSLPASPPHPSTSDNRFFRFRFGSGGSASRSAVPSRAQSPGPTRSSFDKDASHLTSASLPSLAVVDTGPSQKEQELSALLEQERKRFKTAEEDKKALEAELESLSQALFEEANKMVAQERIKCAEMEEELENARREREALKGALKIIELENGQLRSLSHPNETPSAPTDKEHLPELSPVSPFVANIHSPASSEESTVLESTESAESVESPENEAPTSTASSPLTLKSPRLHPTETEALEPEGSPWADDT